MSDDLSDFDEVCSTCERYPGDCPQHDRVQVFADGVPLPPEPVDEVPPVEPLALPPRSADEIAAMTQRWERARRVHVATPRTFTRWSQGGFDPRGRHVGCDGEPGPTGEMRGGCGRPPGLPCEHPRLGEIVGFVHPTRLAAERRLFTLD